jgi:hypothetical protein
VTHEQSRTRTTPTIRSIWGMNHNVISQERVPHPQPLPVGIPTNSSSGRRYRRSRHRIRDRRTVEDRQGELEWALGIWD